MAEKKLVDTEYKTVVVENRNPEDEAQSTFVGGNNVVINGVKEIKHYRIQLGKEVSLPVTFIEQLKNRSMVAKTKNKQTVTKPVFIVEEVKVEVA